ncbi:putative uncharacterized protein [Waddlia chondrophila 2032/99]|uniref:Uncharacterized protein n=2 Tax=Waddlia chondrophila TaxID=71667 RepID=D6YTQ6_WADCW|nr:hypothetical protein [Waddlia chondrophila]ADI37517.1 conserved hypothetical protein [Waddlia chondrophila WSU 86-1044]CCB90466.1 putative uncharacterized protein [Waddlia chondrophila 2032/99]
MYCWKCQKQLDDPPSPRLPFRATCDHCSAWLHCCVNCRNYQPGLPNDCKIPGTEQIADREACNFCDEFSLKETNDLSSSSIEEASKKLFGEETKFEKKNFNDLFND